MLESTTSYYTHPSFVSDATNSSFPQDITSHPFSWTPVVAFEQMSAMPHGCGAHYLEACHQLEHTT